MATCLGIADDGSAVEVAVPPDCADELGRRWPPLGLRRAERPGPVTVERRLTIRLDHATDEVVAHVDGRPSPGGWERIESDLALFAAERLDRLVAVHAALVLDATSGQALLVPGPSGAGKSHLCVAAAAFGATVLSDEFGLVDPETGLVTGWPRPVRIRKEGGGVERIDLAQEAAPVPVGLVALVTYAPGGVEWQPISAADAVVGLLANTVCARSRPDESLDAALAIARPTPAVGGERGDATAAVIALLDLMRSGPPSL